MAVSHINSNDSLNTGRIKVNQTIDNIKRSLVYYSLPYNTEIPDYDGVTGIFDFKGDGTARIIWEDEWYEVPANTRVINETEGSHAKLLFNTSTKQFYFIYSYSPTSLDELTLAMVRSSSAGGTRAYSDLFEITLRGEQQIFNNSIHSDKLTANASNLGYLPPSNLKKPTYNPDSKVFSFNSDGTSRIIYGNSFYTIPDNLTIINTRTQTHSRLVFDTRTQDFLFTSAYGPIGNSRIALVTIREINDGVRLNSPFFDVDIETKIDDASSVLFRATKTRSPGRNISFVFLTDTHGDWGNSYRVMNDNFQSLSQMTSYGKIDFVVHGGDLHSGYYSDKDEALRNFMESMKSMGSYVPVYLVNGNHDDNSYSINNNNQAHLTVTRREWANFVIKNFEHEVCLDLNNPLSRYFYRDFTDQKVRAIFLDACDYPYIPLDDGTLKYSGNTNGLGYSQSQINWLVNNALDLQGKEDYQLLIFTHIGTRKSVLQTWQGVPKNSESIEGILKAFKEGSNYSYHSNAEDWEVSVEVTFDRSHDIIGIFYGHTHRDFFSKPNDLGIPFFNTTMCQLSTNGAMDVITINLDDKEVHATRLGDGSDRSYQYGTENMSND
ncbi:metallophosphoesterase family protein [Alkalihalobacillus pseudalcaliphilus]|uniref:metallophosphoesterase family protein n=1 Tax=Alkalihalobacillus pseudalcaliphilus TaxID=79884 RepID=UPI00064D73E9|nr:metallophosphoesterase [Alkalihalobacillus pseudalcaliphilus]KMK75462.1 hypothetical protein AB990_09135 [Alkalihalobacillus pseudalcaliphilus]